MRSICALILVALTMGLAGACSCGAQCNHGCHVGNLDLLIPADRLSDVESIVGTGTCDQGFSPPRAAGFPPGHYTTVVHGAGTCHVAVSFLSGAPDFVGDVQTAFGSPCCTNAAYAQPSFLSVPEIGSVDGGTGADASADASDHTAG
jgi:hypothetical protein